MSRLFRDKSKDLVNLEVVPASQVWEKNKSGKFVYKKCFNIFGKVEKGSSAFITNTNVYGQNSKFIDDTYNLSKKTKNEIVKHFSLHNRTAYLVKKK